MKSHPFFLLITLYFSTTTGSTEEACPNVNYIKSFNVSKFLGLWHQFAVSGEWCRDPCEKSVTLDWALSEGGRNITITMSRVCSKGMICRRKQTIWRAELGNPNSKTGKFNGKLNLTVHSSDLGRSSLDLLIVSTDYSHSAVLYACRAAGNRTMAIWILTREKKPNDMEMADILTTVDATLERNHLDHFEFRITNRQCENVIKEHSKTPKKVDNDTAKHEENYLSSMKKTTPENTSTPKLEKTTKIANNTTSSKYNKINLNTTILPSEVNKNKTESYVPKQGFSKTSVRNPVLKNSRDKAKQIKAEQNLYAILKKKQSHTPCAENYFENNSRNDTVILSVLNKSSINDSKILKNKGKLKTQRQILNSSKDKHFLRPMVESLPYENSTDNNYRHLYKQSKNDNQQIRNKNNQSGKHVLQSVLDNLTKQIDTSVILSEKQSNKLHGSIPQTNRNNRRKTDLLEEKPVSETFSNNGFNTGDSDHERLSETREDKFAEKQELGTFLPGESYMPPIARQAFHAFFPRELNLDFLHT